MENVLKMEELEGSFGDSDSDWASSEVSYYAVYCIS